MMSAERQQTIKELLTTTRMVYVSALAEMFSVSEMTIRRDLEALEKRGVLRRVYGGAVVEEALYAEIHDVPIHVRSVDKLPEKQAIAERAVQLIEPNDVIILDAGTTTLEIAKRLKDWRGLVVITNSLPVAWELAGGGPSLLMIGGQIRGSSLSAVGSKATAFLSDIVVNTVFLAASGLSLERGIMNSNLDESEVKRLMMGRCNKVVLVSDTSKFQNQAYHVVAGWDEIDTFITDDRLPDDVCEKLSALGVDLIKVGVSTSESILR
ncbi:MAG: DeoR/GlpR transcriptional regulator [Sulfobacillus acidophilus]|uniref:DeoR/GlpR transcriptional regulator n=1 Tax=Sulfobacillus acidophilus TaxID=53633 RepID=A0A2T2WKH1_9FIRM|nr:MAG: DeoR/GlpR transcriptional regulator [Sulfobacillus acidophilus]